MKTLKANATEIRMYNRIKKAYKILTEINNKRRSYDYGRYAGIMFNVKQYASIDADDVEFLCNSSNLPKSIKKQILEEFDSNRLENIYHHSIEWSRACTEEYLAGAQTTSKTSVNKIWNDYLATGETQNPSLDSILSRKRTQNSKRKAFLEFWADDIKMSNALEHTHEVIGFYGKSGGWLLAIKDLEEICQQIEYVLENLFTFDIDQLRIVICERLNTETREDWHHQVSYEFDPNEILNTAEEILHLFEIVKSYVAEFDLKEELLYRLQNEITEFAAELNPSIQIYFDSVNLIEEWKKGSNYFPRTKETYLRIKEGSIQTSKGIKIPEESAQELFLSLLNKRTPAKIGFYNIDFYDGKFLKAGCHKISVDEINSIATSKGWSTQILQTPA